MVTFQDRQAALAAVKFKVYFSPSMSMKTPAALRLWGTASVFQKKQKKKKKKDIFQISSKMKTCFTAVLHLPKH